MPAVPAVPGVPGVVLRGVLRPGGPGAAGAARPGGCYGVGGVRGGQSEGGEGGQPQQRGGLAQLLACVRDACRANAFLEYRPCEPREMMSAAGGLQKRRTLCESVPLLYSKRRAGSRAASRVTGKVQHFFAPAAERPAPCGAGLPAVIGGGRLGERPALAGAEGQPGQPEEADAQRGELRRLGRGGGRGADVDLDDVVVAERGGGRSGVVEQVAGEGAGAEGQSSRGDRRGDAFDRVAEAAAKHVDGGGAEQPIAARPGREGAAGDRDEAAARGDQPIAARPGREGAAGDRDGPAARGDQPIAARPAREGAAGDRDGLAAPGEQPSAFAPVTETVPPVTVTGPLPVADSPLSFAPVAETVPPVPRVN